jgi:uncharacterized protein YbcI
MNVLTLGGLMLIDVYHHKHWDQINGCHVLILRFSTEDRIKRARGELIPETRRQIDERLLDLDGRAIVELHSDEWKLLCDLSSRKGQRGTVSGNVDRRILRDMAVVGLITSHSLNLSTTEHELTDLGRLALDQLS